MDLYSRSRRTAPARRLAASRVVAVLAAVVVAALSAAACSASPASEQSVSDAYRSAHPAEGVPATLGVVEMSRAEVADRIACVVADDVRVVLPTRLPPGFGPSAPYIAVGDGTARPNPEGWGRSYRISYTDGHGLLVMTVGAESVPDGVSWSCRQVHVDGRTARVGHLDNAVVVATRDERPRIVVIGRLLPDRWVLRCARSVRPPTSSLRSPW
jgi:hypothetical protein